jgi:hypothetical protein
MVSFTSENGITVTRLNGQGHRTLQLPGYVPEGARLLGFRTVSPPELVMTSGDLDLITSTLQADGMLVRYELETERARELLPLHSGSMLPARLRNPDPGANSVRGGQAWIGSRLPLLSVEPTGDGSASAKLVRVDPGDGKFETVYEIANAWTDDAGRVAFQSCAAVEEAPDRRWQPEERSTRRYNEPQVLFGDCSAAARRELAAGVVRLVGARSGNVVYWPLPTGWRGRIHRIHLSPDQRTVLLDVRSDGTTDDHAITLALNGEVRTYPASWTPLGWTSFDYFLLQREHNGAVTFAVGDARDGQIYDLFPNNELRELLEQRRLEQEALAGAANLAPAQR